MGDAGGGPQAATHTEPVAAAEAAAAAGAGLQGKRVERQIYHMRHAKDYEVGCRLGMAC